MYYSSHPLIRPSLPQWKSGLMRVVLEHTIQWWPLLERTIQWWPLLEHTIQW